MKKLILTFFSIASIIGLSSAIIDSDCDTRTLKKEGITELNPFYYSAAKVNIINYDYKASRKEIEVPLFKGEKYKMVFNKKGLPQDVLIEIFDRDKTHEHRKPVFTTEGSNTDVVSYSPEKSRKMYVRYTIPKADDVKESGCLVFLLGYQLTFVKEEEK